MFKGRGCTDAPRGPKTSRIDRHWHAIAQRFRETVQIATMLDSCTCGALKDRFRPGGIRAPPESTARAACQPSCTNGWQGPVLEDSGHGAVLCWCTMERPRDRSSPASTSPDRLLFACSDVQSTVLARFAPGSSVNQPRHPLCIPLGTAGSRFRSFLLVTASPVSLPSAEKRRKEMTPHPKWGSNP